jgi:hypothetical protein
MRSGGLVLTGNTLLITIFRLSVAVKHNMSTVLEWELPEVLDDWLEPHAAQNAVRTTVAHSPQGWVASFKTLRP